MLKKWSPQKWVSSFLHPLHPINLHTEVRPSQSTEVCSLSLHPGCYYLVQRSPPLIWAPGILLSHPHASILVATWSQSILHSTRQSDFAKLCELTNVATCLPSSLPFCQRPSAVPQDLARPPPLSHSPVALPLPHRDPYCSPLTFLHWQRSGVGSGGEMSHYYSHTFDACDCLCP